MSLVRHSNKRPASPLLPPKRPRLGSQSIPEPGVEADFYFSNLYVAPPDFDDLARRDPEFAPFLKNGQLDFNDAAATLQLTRTLAKVDFGLTLELPDDRLCPPIPNRHNYILWLKGLFDSTSSTYYPKTRRPIVGLDIGTGASCIYPLLGCAQRPWSFFATDIDAQNHESAARNIALNAELASRITLLPLRQASDPLIPVEALAGKSPSGAGSLPYLDFVMMNPPFYSSHDEILACAAGKNRPPPSGDTCAGAPVEMITPGGEVAFVSRMLDESLTLRGKVGWYTAMLGKHESVEILIDKIRQQAIGNYAVAELVQGRATRRWVLGWSFRHLRPRQDVARGVRAGSLKGGGSMLPPISEADVVVVPARDGKGRESVGARVLGERVNESVAELELLSWGWDQDRLEGTGRAPENVWCRAWRRKQQKRRQQQQEKQEKQEQEKQNGLDKTGQDADNTGSAGAGVGGGVGGDGDAQKDQAPTKEQESGVRVGEKEDADDDDKAYQTFGFKMEVRTGKDTGTGTCDDVRVWCRWLEGDDALVFESFRGWLKRKVEQGGLWVI